MIFRSHRSSVLMLALGCLPAVVGCDNKQASQTETTNAVAPQNAVPAIPASIEQPKAVMSAIDPNTWMTRLDPDMKDVIDQLTALNGKPIETLSAVDARKQPGPTDAVKALMKKQDKSTTPEKVGSQSNKTITLSTGKLPVRITTPEGKGPFPVIVYFHGGGWVIADNDAYDASQRELANGVQAIVVSPEYRKAPENKFPAAHDDAIATYEWVLKNAASINGDPKKISVAGESAGGNMAANVAIAARDKNEQAPLSLLLIYPVASNDLKSVSEIENAQAKPLNQPMMSWFTQQYFNTPADANDPRINLVAANLKGLPPTTIINAQVDPLRSDGELLAQKMKAAGDKVDQKTFTGVTHEFFGMGAVVKKASDAEQMGIQSLKAGFGGS